MKIWKKQSVHYFNEDGKRCPKAKSVKRKTVESKRFYGTLKLANGKSKQMPLTEDRESSETLLRRLQTEADQKRALGITEADEWGSQGVLEALTAYVAYLAMKGNVEEYVRTCDQRLRKLFIATKTKTLSDMDSGKILTTLNQWRTKDDLSVSTTNHYVRAVKSFAKWLVRERKLKDDPFVGLQTQNARADRRRVRRAFTDEELGRLLNDTQACDKRYLGSDWQFLPADRVMLYRLAVSTGLRAKEISALTVHDFDFHRRVVIVRASTTKNRRPATLPLTDSLCQSLPEFFKRLKSDRLFVGSWIRQRLAGKMLQRDMKRSGIPTTDPNGKTLDFHSLRYTFISNLAKANVHPSKAQRLARHSTIALTMDVYTQLDVDDLRGAVDSLPGF